jgi:hypothetical protein
MSANHKGPLIMSAELSGATVVCAGVVRWRARAPVILWWTTSTRLHREETILNHEDWMTLSGLLFILYSILLSYIHCTVFYLVIYSVYCKLLKTNES